jgi:putative transposase
MSRGNARQAIFADDRDRLRFLEFLGESVTRFDWILYAYALMPNHFHLLVQITSETLSRGMQWLNERYAIAFNRRHDRVGHLTQGRFKSPPVDKETYLQELIRYIVLNPVRANIVKRPEDYRWSSYRATAGLTQAPSWLSVDDVLLPFGQERDLARAGFRDFVNAAIGVDSSFWRDLFEKSYIGGDEWMEEIRERIALKPRSTEHPRVERIVKTPSMSDVVAAVAESFRVEPARIRCGIDRLPRMLAAWIAWNECLLTGSQIGAGLGLKSAGYISDLVRRCDRELDRDLSFRETARRCLSTLGRKTKNEDLTP